MSGTHGAHKSCCITRGEVGSALVQEEAQQLHEQKLAQFAHGILQDEFMSSEDSPLASASAPTQPNRSAAKRFSNRPDTAFEDRRVQYESTSMSSSNQRNALPGAFAKGHPEYTDHSSVQVLVNTLTASQLGSDSSLQADQLPVRTAQASSKTRDNLSPRHVPVPPKKAVGKARPSPRPCQTSRCQ